MREVHGLLRAAVAAAINDAQRASALPPFEAPVEIPLERPKQSEMGDLATPVCLQLARVARMPPLKIAEIVATYLRLPDAVSRATVAPPGFVNFVYDRGWLQRQVERVLAEGGRFGSGTVGGGRKVQVEYVSANPTGYLHMGSARNAVLGDVLAAVLAAAGCAVHREYLVNDAGSRMRLFYESMWARYLQALGEPGEVPADGYHGADIVEMAATIALEDGKRYLALPRDDAVRAVGQRGLEAVVQSAERDLEAMGIRYDRWFSEQTLYADGTFDRVMRLLGDGGHLEERDGAVWFRASALGGAKDEVVVRSDGTPGYFASDIAYHYDKFVLRGFETVIDVWGADHQGHVPRMKAMMRALGLDPTRLVIILYQLVTLKRGGEIVRLSKRTGDTITLREVLDDVGPDAVRYFLLSRSADSQMDFDLDLAKEQSDANPVYYIQYAHARICSILRLAGAIDLQHGDVSLLNHPAELLLIRQMIRLPEIIEAAAVQLAPHLLAYYAYELASAFHAFYRDCRVVGAVGDEPITLARLKLVSACQIAVARVLGLMGMRAPESM